MVKKLIHTQQNKKFMKVNKKNFGFYSVIIVFVVIFIASAIIFKVYNIEILPSQFYGALIGVFITAIVTAFLLRGQTDGDEKREKSVKIFEEKLKIYKDFLTKLHEVVEEEKISDKNVKDLIFQISYIAMHTPPDKVNKILEKLETTIKGIDDNGNGYEMLAKNILDIMLVLQESLYFEKLEKTDKNTINPEIFKGLITEIEETAKPQPLNIKVVDIFRKNNFLIANRYADNEKTLRFEIEGRDIKFELLITCTHKGYVGIRNRYDTYDKNETYIKMVKDIKGFQHDPKYPWFGTKSFKNYGTNNENELVNKIKEDIETFIKNLKQ